MLNVLLADDETRTLHHLMTGVPWFQLGMEVCCTASNGSEALAFIESHPIDRGHGHPHARHGRAGVVSACA